LSNTSTDNAFFVVLWWCRLGKGGLSAFQNAEKRCGYCSVPVVLCVKGVM
jgi:hypothetical protein